MEVQEYLQYLSKYSDVTITEFSEKSVSAMKKYLNLNAIKLTLTMIDYQKLSGKYDLIISESNINYCENKKIFI